MNDTMQLRVVQMFSSFVSHVTNGVRAADEVENKEDARNAFKAAVYFLIMALMEISRLQVQADKDIMKKGKVCPKGNTQGFAVCGKLMDSL